MHPNTKSFDNTPPKRRESVLNMDQKCRNHGKIFSHFCKEEIRLLCPDCLKSHEKEHHTYEFKKAKDMVLDSIDGFQRKLKKTMEDMNSMAFPDFGNFYNEQIALISNAKMYIQEKIQEYFNLLEENFTLMFNKVPSVHNKEKLMKEIQSYMDYLDEINKKRATGINNVELQEFFSKDISGYEEELDKKFFTLSKYNENPATELQVPEIVLREEKVSGLITQLPEYFGIRKSVYSNKKQKLFGNASFKVDESMDKNTHSSIPILDETKGTLGFYSFDETERNSIPLDKRIFKSSDSSKLILPDNSIFVCGGIDPQNQAIQSETLKVEDSGDFKELNPMRVKRIGHSLCWLEDGQKGLVVFAIGGKTKEGISTKLCERYSFKSQAWENISMLNFARSRASVCVWKSHQIYAFYGTDSSGQVVPSIEVFEISRNFWKMLSVTNRMPFVESTCTFSVAINTSQIMIFGGFYEGNDLKQFCSNTKITIFNVEEESIEYESGRLDYHIFNYNDGGIVKHKGKIFAVSRSFKENTPVLKMDLESFFIVSVKEEMLHMERILKF